MACASGVSRAMTSSASNSSNMPQMSQISPFLSSINFKVRSHRDVNGYDQCSPGSDHSVGDLTTLDRLNFTLRQ